MNERVMRFRVGVMMLATLIIAATLVLLIGKLPSLIEGTYTVLIDFKSAPGVGANTPIKKHGILIGRVATIGFNEDNTGALVTAKITSQYRLRADEIPMITSGVLGDAVIEFVDDDLKEDADEFIEDGARLRGGVRSSPLDVISHIEGDLSVAIKSISRTSDEIGALSHNVNDILGANDQQFKRIVDKTEQTIDGLRDAVGNIDEFLGDRQLKDDFKRAISGFPALLEETRETVGGLRDTLSGVGPILTNVELFTRPLGERGEQLASAMDHLDKVLADLAAFSDGLNDPKGTLGQLLNNPDLYQQANSAVANLNELTSQLRPIVSDVRTFTNKIARHPNQLIFRNSGAKYSSLQMNEQGVFGNSPPRHGGLSPAAGRHRH
ncbi:MAG TPA: MlaD family protein [Pirellulales bacterium]|nr:MlaD family protein [Pirellulales bacterium]